MPSPNPQFQMTSCLPARDFANSSYHTNYEELASSSQGCMWSETLKLVQADSSSCYIRMWHKSHSMSCTGPPTMTAYVDISGNSFPQISLFDSSCCCMPNSDADLELSTYHSITPLLFAAIESIFCGVMALEPRLQTAINSAEIISINMSFVKRWRVRCRNIGHLCWIDLNCCV